MSRLVRIPIMCNDETHYVSLWQPGDEITCGREHVLYSINKNIVCFENHDLDIDLTIADLTGIDIPCIKFFSNYLPILFNNIHTATLDFDLVKFVILAGGDAQSENNLALRFAISDGNTEITDFLIQHGANTSAIDHRLFVQVSENGKLKGVELIIKYRPELLKESYQPIYRAMQNGHIDVAELIINHIVAQTGLIKSGSKISRLNYLLKLIKKSMR